MPHLRRNLWGLPEWDPILLWYARAIARMQERPLDDPTSWRWQAAIHGIHGGLIAPGDSLPDDAAIEDYWNQCQHGSWFFLPWHRGYLAAFEQIVRAAVVDLGGPDDWALPYWDCGRPEWRRLRPEFCTPDLPDGEGDNRLFVPERRPGFETGDVGITARGVALDAILIQPQFGGSRSGGGTGFGGPATDFFHGPGPNGALEGGIHNYIHSRVGGDDGLMSGFETAGLDPLFWLHHCNVDRLWEVWRRRDPRHRDPTDSAWTRGPRSKAFRLHDASGQPFTFTSAEMVQTSAPRLDYSYEDVSDPLGGRATPPRLRGFAGGAAQVGGMGMAGSGQTQTRVLGASAPGVALGAGRTSARLEIERPRAPAAHGFGAAPVAERILLNLENITGVSRGQSYRVYVNLPDDGDPETEERQFVGMMSLFGVDAASAPDGAHAGNGLTYVFDITELARARPGDTARTDELTVDFLAEDEDVRPDAAKVGRISIVHETQ